MKKQMNNPAIINPRKYGSGPFCVAVVHGGPGATGEMAPVARRLSARRGVLEPMQTACTLPAQAEELLELGRRIVCPVTAIHGDWDPHPYKGVSEPLQETLKSFRFILLESCGHKPWIERREREKFFSVLEEEILEGVIDSSQPQASGFAVHPGADLPLSPTHRILSRTGRRPKQKLAKGENPAKQKAPIPLLFLFPANNPAAISCILFWRRASLSLS